MSKMPKELVQEAVECLKKFNGNVTNAAQHLGLARSTFRDRIAAGKSGAYVRPEEDIDVDTGKRHTELRSLKNKKVNRYVITAAQNATPVFAPFWNALLRYCEFNKAELIVVPYRYKNPTSTWTTENETQNWWADEVLPYLLNQRIEQIGRAHV